MFSGVREATNKCNNINFKHWEEETKGSGRYG